ncbi:hypothetical protein WJX75_003290 [Coccomyxa subellipsoidea]|uniref:2-C-methyl-D-erythritol 2,4-cyclodiphosphate synthase n=1 Tax=Coccomyxa subellipsoidea TaxID=248742 RepID=A0ABR2YRH5_9CHLO
MKPEQYANRSIWIGRIVALSSRQSAEGQSLDINNHDDPYPLKGNAASSHVGSTSTATASTKYTTFRAEQREQGAKEDLETICDALLHTVTDAILGALCQPDIGQLFPDNDPKWKGQTSDVFLLEAVRLMHEFGYVLGNIDATIILQRPKLSPHKEKIRANLCQLLGADPSVVNIKAKTHEKVDSLGENRSIAVHAVCMLIREDMVQ